MKNKELIEKAYELDFSKIDEGYLYSEEIVYAYTRGLAKSALLSRCQYENIELNSGDEMTFLNVPIRRCKQYDKFLFEGERITSERYKSILQQRARWAKLDQMLIDYRYAYIMKRGTYYLPGSCGYTAIRERAGLYTISEAVMEAKGCDEIFLEPVDIEVHNKMIQKEIESLREKIIHV
jgi:hypothetical protein